VYEKQLHQDQAMRSMQLQNGTSSQANTPFAQPQTPINNIQSLTLDTLSPAQLNTNNATAQSSPRTAVLNGSQQMQRNQSRSTGIGVGSGSMLPPQSPANRTTTPKPIGVGIGVGVGKATPKMVKEELVSHANIQYVEPNLTNQKDSTPKSLQPSPSNAIVHIADHAGTTSTHGLTPSPPSGSTISPPQPLSDNQPKAEGLTLTIDPPPGEGIDPNFSADFTDTNFLEGDFNFDASGFDSTFDFGQYLAEFGADDGDTEVGVV
jgi:hypothetical protein